MVVSVMELNVQKTKGSLRENLNKGNETLAWHQLAQYVINLVQVHSI